MCDVGYLCVNFDLPIGLSVLDLGPMYPTDVRQTSDVRHKHRLMPRLLGAGHNNDVSTLTDSLIDRCGIVVTEPSRINISLKRTALVVVHALAVCVIYGPIAAISLSSIRTHCLRDRLAVPWHRQCR